jgi:hypothetical protein
VPGIDSADAFCRSWSEFAGSFQALALASAVDPDPVAGARLEVVASPAVDRAAGALSEAFPGEIANERPVFLDGVVGPFANRSSLAGEELLTAGLTIDDRDELVLLWLEALVAEQPVVAVTVPDELDKIVDAAAAAFARRVPPIAEDPSLVTDASAPATFAYIADNCPDQGILGGTDAID